MVTLAPVDDGGDPDPINLVSVIKDADIAVDEDSGLMIQASDVATDPEGGSGALKFVPDQDFNGAESAIVKVTDDTGNSTEITVSLNVAAVNDDPDAGSENGGDFTAGELLELRNLLGNDSDVDDDTLRILSVSSNTSGFFAKLSVNANGTVVGKLTDDASVSGTFDYTSAMATEGPAPQPFPLRHFPLMSLTRRTIHPLQPTIT